MEREGNAAARPVEELAAALGVKRSVLAAVRQQRGWADCKKVTEAEFKSAVDAFLGGSTQGGK